jgi:hypothetical protein
MPMESKSAVVPADIARDVDEIVNAIRAAAEQEVTQPMRPSAFFGHRAGRCFREGPKP